jgi:xylan 1,4-beta-xylosidase
MMSFWTFSDVFEEGGPISRPFEGQFGLRAKGGINKPSYYDFGLLHQLGDQRIANPSSDVIVTTRKDGTLVIALWNLVDPDKTGAARNVQLIFRGIPANASASISRVDDEHGNMLAAYKKMGSPVDPTEAQVEQLNRETALAAPAHSVLGDGKLNLSLGVNALLLIEVRASSTK